MSPEARTKLADKARDGAFVADETRQAAEALSAKFTDRLPQTDPEDSSKPSQAHARVAVADPEERSGTPAHVAVLVSEGPSARRAVEETKSDKTNRKQPTKKSVAAAPRKPKHARTKQMEAAPAPPGRAREWSNPHPDSQRLASTEVPGAAVGWRTGFLGLLTNPAFWH
jgi:hypothetical protein